MKLSNKKLITLIVFIVIVALFAVFSPDFRENIAQTLEVDTTAVSDNTAEVVSAENKLEVHVIDIGQGDSTLIKAADFNVLIDAGTGKGEEKLLAYLDDVGVDTIDIMFLTHPHEDHIGGADAVLDSLTVKEILMPDATTNTKAFERVLDGTEEHGVPISTVFRGDTFTEGGLEFLILSPDDKKYSDLNNSSIVMKVTCGDVSMMFTGDAEALVENEILEEYDNETLKCVFYKTGHHGSSTSNTEAFVKAVSPTYASISCGVDNSYGHPHIETVTTFEKLGVSYRRTDLEGSLVYVTDGKTFEPVE